MRTRLAELLHISGTAEGLQEALGVYQTLAKAQGWEELVKKSKKSGCVLSCPTAVPTAQHADSTRLWVCRTIVTDKDEIEAMLSAAANAFDQGSILIGLGSRQEEAIASFEDSLTAYEVALEQHPFDPRLALTLGAIARAHQQLKHAKWAKSKSKSRGSDEAAESQEAIESIDGAKFAHRAIRIVAVAAGVEDSAIAETLVRPQNSNPRDALSLFP